MLAVRRLLVHEMLRQQAAGIELGADYRAMTPDRRSGDLLPEHLVGQQAPDGEHLTVYRGAATNGGGA